MAGPSKWHRGNLGCSLSRSCLVVGCREMKPQWSGARGHQQGNGHAPSQWDDNTRNVAYSTDARGQFVCRLIARAEVTRFELGHWADALAARSGCCPREFTGPISNMLPANSAEGLRRPAPLAGRQHRWARPCSPIVNNAPLWNSMWLCWEVPKVAVAMYWLWARRNTPTKQIGRAHV